MNQKENTLYSELQFWSFFGPIVLAFTSVMAFYNLSNFSLPLLLVILAGAYACWRWKRKALLPTVALIAIAFLVGYNAMASSDRLFQLSMYASLVLAFVAYTFSTEETEDIRKLLQFEFSSNAGSIEKEQVERNHLIQSLQEKIDLLTADKENFTSHILNLEGLLAKSKRESSLFSELINKQDREIAAYSREMELAKSGIDAVNVQLQTLAQEMESLQVSYEKLRREENEKIVIPDNIDIEQQLFLAKKNEHRAESLYKQLRKQFEEKDEALNIARSELFHTKEKLAVLQKEKEEASYCDTDPYVQALHRHLAELGHENDHLREVNKKLEALIRV